MLAAFIATMTLAAAEAASDSASPVYEMRVYYSPEGKLDNLHARFRDHTLRIFEKHGIKSVAYFVPAGENPEHKLIYFLSFPSRAAREKAWKEFFADPEWQKAARESEANGKIVQKVENYFLTPTDYSPKLDPHQSAGPLFELRTYRTPEGKLEKLDERFKEHTMELFKKHGMENLIYWHKMSDQKDAETTLVYLLGHKDKASFEKSWDGFRQDPEWVKAKTASEKEGALTVGGGVKSELLVPTDYSPLK